MSKASPRRRKKISARQAMHAKRAQAPEINPCPTGPTGGRYKPLSETDVKKIYDASLVILSDIGMGEAPPALVEQCLSKGAIQSDTGRLCFPKAMVEDIIAGACREFILPGRDTNHDIEIGGEKVYFGTGGAAVQTM